MDVRWLFRAKRYSEYAREASNLNYIDNNQRSASRFSIKGREDCRELRGIPGIRGPSHVAAHQQLNWPLCPCIEFSWPGKVQNATWSGTCDYGTCHTRVIYLPACVPSRVYTLFPLFLFFPPLASTSARVSHDRSVSGITLSPKPR